MNTQTQNISEKEKSKTRYRSCTVRILLRLEVEDWSARTVGFSGDLSAWLADGH